MDQLFCKYVTLPAGTEPLSFAAEIQSSSGPKPDPFLCCGHESGACAVFDSMGCRPAAAECRYAQLVEPKRDEGRRSIPQFVGATFCPGEDFCALEACQPQPRFMQDYA